VHKRGVIYTTGETGENWKKKVLSLFEGYGALKLVLVSILIYIFTEFLTKISMAFTIF